ncbi:hypothetical protein GTA08_BOTSDO03983 [Neofusicoccum parvum]|nr:hypothetical protein GTA08_BOTSDO03983 [Neofusicoccum parvum]
MPSAEQRLFILDCDLSHWSSRSGRIVSCRVDGSDQQTVVKDLHELPDGIAIDHARGHIYWTNMGTSGFSSNDGSIQRCNLDGTSITTIIPQASTFTPKQIAIAQKAQKLYWCDREGMRVMRSNLDGSGIETLVQTGATASDRQDKTRWCVGIALDEERGHFYWSQKGPSKGNVGRIFRAPIAGPPAAYPAARPDVELLLDGLPEPIDLELDVERQLLYWTDRGDPPRGNTLNRAFVGAGRGDGKLERRILAIRLHETIGLALDAGNQVVYVTDLAGGVYRVKVDGDEGEKEVLFSELGDLTGITLAEN